MKKSSTKLFELWTVYNKTAADQITKTKNQNDRPQKDNADCDVVFAIIQMIQKWKWHAS